MLHEIDHLNGILFFQHVSRLKREIIKRKIRRLRRKGEWDDGCARFLWGPRSWPCPPSKLS